MTARRVNQWYKSTRMPGWGATLMIFTASLLVAVVLIAIAHGHESAAQAAKLLVVDTQPNQLLSPTPLPTQENAPGSGTTRLANPQSEIPNPQSSDPAPTSSPSSPNPKSEIPNPQSATPSAPRYVVVDSPIDQPTFDGRPLRKARTIRMNVTAYSPDARSCAPFDDNITASGFSVWTNGGKLVAADTKVLPFGSIISIPGYNEGRPVPVLDRGGKIKGNRLDVLYPTHEIARIWGVQNLNITVWEYAD